MVKKIIYLLVPVLFLAFFASSIRAENTTAGSAQTATDAASRLKEQIQFLKQGRINLKQQIKDAAAAKRLEVKAAIDAKREEFRAKLQAIKDLKKKALVERIDTKLININLKHTDRFAQVLNNLQIILDKMPADIDITNAKKAIDSAKTAVENQTAKTYTIAISTESALRSDVGIIVSQLRKDLITTYKLVVEAKQTVQGLRANSAIMKKEATNSANL